MTTNCEELLNEAIGDMSVAKSILELFKSSGLKLITTLDINNEDPVHDNHSIVIVNVDDYREKRYELYRKGLWKYILVDRHLKEANYSTISLVYHLLTSQLSFEKTTIDNLDPFTSGDIVDELTARSASREVLRRFAIIFHELCANAAIHGKQTRPYVFHTFSNDYLIVKILDDAGKLKITDLQKIFYIKDKSKVNDGSKQTAGIGYQMIEKYAHGLMINVIPNEKTEITFALNFRQTQYHCNFLLISRE